MLICKFILQLIRDLILLLYLASRINTNGEHSVPVKEKTTQMINDIQEGSVTSQNIDLALLLHLASTNNIALNFKKEKRRKRRRINRTMYNPK